MTERANNPGYKWTRAHKVALIVHCVYILWVVFVLILAQRAKAEFADLKDAPFGYLFPTLFIEIIQSLIYLLYFTAVVAGTVTMRPRWLFWAPALVLVVVSSIIWPAYFIPWVVMILFW